MRRALRAAPAFLLIALGPAQADPPIVTTRPPGAPPAAEKKVAIDETAIQLAQAARNLPSEDRIQATRAALSIVLLSRFNRLLPSNLPAAQLDELAAVFLSDKPDASRQNAFAKRLPPADSLVYDGSRLAGGNFRNIDAIMGADGRPVALDRELPAWIVPLEPAAASALEMEKSHFLHNPDSARIADLANRIYQADVAPNLVADGIFLRPYSGRLDDLHHYLVQEGNNSTPLDFFAILDSLPPRLYSPVSGTSARTSVPAGRVNLSDILTGGSLLAVQKFRSANPQTNVRNPFKGFAVRVLPVLGPTLRETSTGQSLRVSRDLMQRILANPRRFTPGKVPPLFNDPSRFLGGWFDPRYLRVSKSKKKSETADLLAEIQKIDFETPLPEMTFEPVGNELLGEGPEDMSTPHTDDLAEEDTRDLMRDLGLNEQVQLAANSEPPPPPVAEAQTTPQPTPRDSFFNVDYKPAPPPFEEQPAVPEEEPIEIVMIESTPTPPLVVEPTPTPVLESTPEPTPLEEKIASAPSPTPTPPVAASTPEETVSPQTTPEPQPVVAEASPSPEPTPVPEPSPVLAEAPQPTPFPTIPPPEDLEENLVAASTPTPTDVPPSAVALIEEPVATPQPVSEPEIRVAEPVATPVPNEPEPTPVQIAKAIPVAPQPEPAEELIPQPAPAPAPPVPSNNRFQVAVLVPTTSQAVGYLKTISASDAALADNMAETKRAEAYIEWLGAAVKPFENELRKNPDSKESQALEKPIRQALGEVAVLKMRLDDLKTQRLRELEARAQARQSLEKEIQTTRRDQLTRLAGTGA